MSSNENCQIGQFALVNEFEKRVTKMGGEKKSKKRLTVKGLRITAFACSLVEKKSDVARRKKPTVSEIQNVLALLDDPLDLGDSTIRNWLRGENHPEPESVDAIKKNHPDCDSWLKPDAELSPTHRFLCALDIWAAPLDSPLRCLDKTNRGITAGRMLSILAKRWVPSPIAADGETFLIDGPVPGFLRKFPDQDLGSFYQPIYPITLMIFMFTCGSRQEWSEAEFAEWAIDLASLTIVVGAFLQTVTNVDLYQAGKVNSYSWLVHCIFFRGHGTWPNYEAVCGAFRVLSRDFRELHESLEIYARQLLRGREILETALFAIGTNLSVVSALAVPGQGSQISSSEPGPKLGAKEKRLSDEQKIAVLRDAENITKIADICRKYGISDSTYYNWKKKFSGMLNLKA